MDKMIFKGKEIDTPRKIRNNEYVSDYLDYLVDHLDQNFGTTIKDEEKQKEYYAGLYEDASQLYYKLNPEKIRKEILDDELEESNDDVIEEEEKPSIFQRIKNLFRPSTDEFEESEEEIIEESKEEKIIESKKEIREISDDELVEAEDMVEKKPNIFRKVFNFITGRSRKNKDAQTPEELITVQNEVVSLKNDIAKLKEESTKKENKYLEELKELREECIRLQTEQNKLYAENLMLKNAAEEIQKISGVKEAINCHNQIQEMVRIENEKINNYEIKAMVEEIVKNQTILVDQQAYYAEQYPFANSREEHIDLYDSYVRFWNQSEVSNMLDLHEKDYDKKHKQKTKRK